MQDTPGGPSFLPPADGTGCPTPKPGLALLFPDGRLIPLPCGRLRCPSCSRYLAVVALEMVRDCSERMGNPTVAVTLTSVDPDRPLGREWSRDVEKVTKAMRRRAPAFEYLAFMEWTSGQAARSGGRRRPHQHFLGRGVEQDQAPALEEVVRTVWEGRTGANRVEVTPLRQNERGIAYLALHHRKESQAPPESFTGRRLRASKGWWGADAHELRREARDRLRTTGARNRVATALIADLVMAGVDPYQLDGDTWGDLLDQRAETAAAPPIVVRLATGEPMHDAA